MNKLFITTAAVAALFSAPVVALEVENKDGKDYYVYVGQGDNIDTVAVASGKTIKGVCGYICTVSIEGEERELAVYSGDKAVIKDGKLEIMRKN